MIGTEVEVRLSNDSNFKIIVTNSPSNPHESPNSLLAIVAIALAVVLTWGPNPLLAGFAIAVLLAAFVLLWRPGESPVMLLVIGLQWLQASVQVLNANLIGLPISEVSQFGGDIATSISLSLTGLLVFALGMRQGAGSTHMATPLQAKFIALHYPVSTWFAWYLIALILGMAAQALAYQISALTQPFLALADLKWAFFFMLTYAVFSRPLQGRGLWLLAFAIELLLGLGGYFSSFRSVFLFSVLSLVAAGVRLTVGRTVLLLVVGGLTVVSAIVWTVVKPEYRNFISGGQEAQVVVEDFQDRMIFLGKLIGDVDGTKFRQGTEDFISRLSYVDFFGSVVNYVPALTAHTDGEIWLDAIARPFMPRVLFPYKSAIDDSVRTAEFTGLEISGTERGTSISIGYMGESYIDFGPIGMMLPILALGYALGRVYRWLVVTGPMNGLLGMGMASAALMSFSLLESSITKVFGGFVAALLVIWLLGRFLAPRYLAWLMPSRAQNVAV